MSAFGDGSDTNLYRSSPNVLRTDDVISAEELHRAQARCLGRTFLSPFVMAATNYGPITRFPMRSVEGRPWRGYSR
jgi:hypothetical protein